MTSWAETISVPNPNITSKFLACLSKNPPEDYTRILQQLANSMSESSITSDNETTTDSFIHMSDDEEDLGFQTKKKGLFTISKAAKQNALEQQFYRHI